MTDDSLPGLHDMLANLPKARVPFEQATEAMYGRLYEAYDKFKALHAEAEAENGRLREEAVELRTTITLLGQSLKVVGEHAETANAELDRFKAAVATMREDHEGCVIGAFDGCQTCIALETLDKPTEADPS